MYHINPRCSVKQCGCDTSHTVVCIGNHDVVRDLEESGKHAEARAAYLKFAKRFANESAVALSINEKATLCQLDHGIWVLAIDSTMGGNPNEPGELSGEDVDKIAKPIYDISGSDLLLVLTHYPPGISPLSVADNLENDPDYHRRHAWRGGKLLRERIRDHRNLVNGRTIWLSGDTHTPDHYHLDEGFCSVTTGRFGTATPKSDSALRRQGKLIEISKTGAGVIAVTVNFGPLGHRESSHVGEWKAEKSEVRTISPVRAQAISVLTATSTSIQTEARAETEKSMAGALETDLIDDGALQEEILKRVASERLYNIGRFHTSDSDISLAWISIGPLLNVEGILSGTINRMHDWLAEKLKSVGALPTGTVILGIDCWGAVIASQLSVQMVARNYCLGARGRGQYSTTHESVSATVTSDIEKATDIVLVSDVVATGRTLRWVYDQVTKVVQEPRRWWGLSIVCDGAQTRSDTLSFLQAMGAACRDLRMPLLARSAVPGEEILPARISFGC